MKHEINMKHETYGICRNDAKMHFQIIRIVKLQKTVSLRYHYKKIAYLNLNKDANIVL